MSSYGDFIIEDDPKGLADDARLLAEQIADTIKLIYPDDKLPEGVAHVTLGWKLREITQQELDAIARRYDRDVAQGQGSL